MRPVPAPPRHFFQEGIPALIDDLAMPTVDEAANCRSPGCVDRFACSMMLFGF